MTIYHELIAALWLAFLAYWAISAGGAKRNVGGPWVWWRDIYSARREEKD
jgi:hypothetical protein